MHTKIHTVCRHAGRLLPAGVLHVDRQTNVGMHARWWQHTTVADGWIVLKMDGSDEMKRHRRRERRTDVGWDLTALIFPQDGLKWNRRRYKGMGCQLGHMDHVIVINVGTVCFWKQRISWNVCLTVRCCGNSVPYVWLDTQMVNAPTSEWTYYFFTWNMKWYLVKMIQICALSLGRCLQRRRHFPPHF